MPTLIYRNLTDDDMTGMDNLNIAKKKFIRKVRGDRDIIESDVRMKELSTQYEAIDKKLLEDNVKGVKSLYRENIKLMLKLKNKFTTELASSSIPPPAVRPPPPPPPPSVIPPFRLPFIPAVPSIPAPSRSARVVSPAPAPSPRSSVPPPPRSARVVSASPAPDVPSIPPAPAPAPPRSARVVRPSISSIMSSLGDMFGSGMKGGKVAIIETMGIGLEITTLSNLITNNLSIIREALELIISNYQFVKSKDINDILILDKKFRGFFNENVVPYDRDDIEPFYDEEKIATPYDDIVNNLVMLYAYYEGNFMEYLIPALEKIVSSYVK